MAEQSVSSYKPLFELRLLHHYWLDQGGTVFDSISEQEITEARLLHYNIHSFLELTPTTSTAKALNGFGCVYKDTALGCVAGAPSTTVIPAEAMFEFVVRVKDSAFFNYTTLTLRAQKIYELYHQPENKTYRYKENVPVLSNLTGASRGAGPNKILFLSREIPTAAASDEVEFLVLFGGALLQLTGDQPGAGTQVLTGSAANAPVYLHQGDVPQLTPPAGLTGVPERGVMLTEDIPDDVFAVIRLGAIRPADASFSLIDANGDPKAPHPVFQIRFKNRSTFWRYRDQSTGEVISTEAEPLPLTFFGNAGTGRKPSPGVVKVETTAGKVTELVSDIFR